MNDKPKEGEERKELIELRKKIKRIDSDYFVEE